MRTVAPESVEQWGIFELQLDGPSKGNPFLEVSVGAEFQYGHRTVSVDGFYDGDGVYRVRFMPDVQGQWHYTTRSNASQLSGIEGAFEATTPGQNNHGCVRVRDTFHFAYDDGTPYWQVGTTCYVWTHQGDVLEEQTLETLRKAPFNKMRMCMFPKHYAYNHNEPPRYPFEQGQLKDWELISSYSGRSPTPEKGQSKQWEWDFSRFNPDYFRHFEKRVQNLMDLGIEADIILFHPYDRWGFATMPPDVDDRYLRYVVARLAAYRNVWWSMANEWDLMPAKSVADWDRFLRITQERDPSQHLRSIHNCHVLFDQAKPPITHVSLQISNFNPNLEQIRDYRLSYRKPIVVDECCYEGDIQERWGNISAQDMVRRFWEGTIHGGYVGHSETYWHPEEIIWWSKGGVMHGGSPERLAFFRKILEDTPEPGLTPIEGVTGGYFRYAGVVGQYYLTYTGLHQPRSIGFDLPAGTTYCAEIIDTWAMTVTSVEGVFEGQFTISLPGQPYIAVRLLRVHKED